MTITITLLLCLGLILGLRTPVLAWTLPKPILRAQPDSVVSKQTNVTFLCEGTTGANQYSLYKSGSSYSWPKQIPLKPENKAEFSISKVEPHHAGLYRCYYHTKDRSSEASEILELVVTGVYSKPRLSAQSSPVVTTGENVTIQCVSWELYHSLILTKEGPQKLSWTQDSQHNPYIRESQALFSVGPVTSSQRWTFRCYSYEKRKRQVWSEPSDPLELLISGNLQKPTIESETGSVVASGSPVTIWCQGTLDAELYALHKEGSQKPWGTQTPEEPGKEAKFSIPYVIKEHGGQYRCYYYSSAGWSEHSDILDLVVTGIYYKKPSLSALPSPVATSGGNMTLQCVSMGGYEKFILTKEDEKFLTSLDSQYIYLTGHYQALFSMENLTADHTGIFRCYGYYKVTPQLWSVPSDPLEIYISDPIGTSSPPPSRPMSTTELEMHVKILIGVSLAFLLLLFMLIFLLLLRKHEGKFRMSGPKKTVLHPPRGTAELVTRERGTQKRANPATATHEGRFYASVEDMQSEDGVDLDSWRPPVEDPQGETYAQVKPSRLRRDGAILPSVMSREFLDTKDGETEDYREMDCQAAKSEDPQDRTYVQICRRTLRLGRASRHPYQAGEDPKQPTVYATLKATGPGPVFKNKK